MAFIKSAISSIYNSVKSFFVNEEKTEEVPEIEPNIENLPSSLKDFDEYIQHLIKEMKEEAIKIDTLIQLNNQVELFNSIALVRANEKCISILNSIKLKSEEPTVENATNKAIIECDKHIEGLKNEFLILLKQALYYIERGELAVNEYNIRIQAILTCSSRLSMIKSQFEDTLSHQSPSNDNELGQQEDVKQESENVQTKTIIDTLDERIEELQKEIDELIKKARNYKKQGNLSKARECLKRKAYLQKSIENHSGMKKNKLKSMSQNQDLDTYRSNQTMKDELIIDLNQSCYKIAKEISDMNMCPDFEDQINEEFECLDVSQLEITSEEDEEKVKKRLMEGYT